MDSLRHPDLVDLGRELRSIYDTVREAQSAAAAIAERRHRSLWDLFVEWEDLGVNVEVDTALYSVDGPVAVSADHVVVGGVAIPFDAIVGARPC